MNVFLSYARDDRPRIREVVRELKSRGILGQHDAIIDPPEMISAGADWRDEIRQAIESASKFVVIWSTAADASGWVNYETGMADALDKPILVAVPRGKTARIPSNLRETQIIELDSVR